MSLSVKLAGLLAVAFASLAHSQSGTAVPAPLPTDFSEGERWEWRVTITPDVGTAPVRTRSVVKTGDGLRFENQRGIAARFNESFETNPFFNTKSLSPFRVWPLEVGKNWDYKAEFMGGETSLTQTAKVVAFEDVTVPAGTFKAYKIVYAGTATKKSGYSWNRVDTHWYAPSVKADVKSLVDTPDHQGVMELVSYKPAQSAADGSTAGPSILSADTIQQSFSGKTFIVKLANGSSWNWQFKADGTHVFNTSGGFSDSGKWSAKDGKLCTEGRKMGASCNDIQAKGALFLYKRDSGEIVEMSVQ
jgi:hypothetical protein